MQAQIAHAQSDSETSVRELLERIKIKIDRIEEGLAPSGRADVVLGAQWGDEGKGKLVDALSCQVRSIPPTGSLSLPLTPLMHEIC